MPIHQALLRYWSKIVALGFQRNDFRLRPGRAFASKPACTRAFGQTRFWKPLSVNLSPALRHQDAASPRFDSGLLLRCEASALIAAVSSLTVGANTRGLFCGS